MVRPETTAMIGRVVDDLAHRYNLETPGWSYYTPTNAIERNILGAYRTDLDQIYFNQEYIEHVEDNPAQVVRLVVHEWRHYWQDLTGFHPDEPDIREGDARNYEWTYLDSIAFDWLPVTRDLMDASKPIQARRCGWYADHLVLQDVPPEVMSTGVVRKISTSRWIRYHLTKEVEEDYVWRMWKAYEALKERAGQKGATYDNFRRYVWVLDELKLVEMVRAEPARFGVRHYYQVVPAGLEDPAWDNPQAARLPKGS